MTEADVLPGAVPNRLQVLCAPAQDIAQKDRGEHNAHPVAKALGRGVRVREVPVVGDEDIDVAGEQGQGDGHVAADTTGR